MPRSRKSIVSAMGSFLAVLMIGQGMLCFWIARDAAPADAPLYNIAAAVFDLAAVIVYCGMNIAMVINKKYLRDVDLD